MVRLMGDCFDIDLPVIDEDIARPARDIRARIRAGEDTGPSRGKAVGFLQCNLVILPKGDAPDFMRYCLRNHRACPLLDVGDPGDFVPHRLAPKADIRTDVSRYAVFRRGRRGDDRTDIGDLWRDDLVCFYIGSGITFDGALNDAGVQTSRYRWVVRTDRPTHGAGAFHGPLVATMRWLTPAEAVAAVTVTRRYPRNHGAPIHLGDPAGIGADLANPLFGGEVPTLPEGLIPVFWACGVTPQSAALSAEVDFMITHAPAHSFITDIPAKALES